MAENRRFVRAGDASPKRHQPHLQLVRGTSEDEARRIARGNSSMEIARRPGRQALTNFTNCMGTDAIFVKLRRVERPEGSGGFERAESAWTGQMLARFSRCRTGFCWRSKAGDRGADGHFAEPKSPILRLCLFLRGNPQIA